MKKVIVILSAVLLSAGIVSAQDFAKATELAKQANESLMAGDFAGAESNFQAALKEAGACTEEGAAELVATCKTGIAQTKYAAVNPLIEADQWKEAIAKLDEAIAVAKEYGEEELTGKAVEKKAQVLQAAANAEIKAGSAEKDPQAKAAHFTEALAYLEASLAEEPTNGKALISKGQVLATLGKKDQAIEAYLLAKENGEEAAAVKQLSNIYVKDASALLKGGKFKEAIAAAEKSAEYNPKNANAFKIAGVASQKAGDLAGAVEHLSKYLEIKPNDTQIAAAVTAMKAQLKK